MTRAFQVQLFLIALIIGFLAGPRVIVALQKLSPTENAASPVEADVASADTLPEAGATASSTFDPFANLSLDAKSVYVWDIDDHRKLYGRNEQNALPLASVTKIMMALVSSEILAPDAKVTITPLDLTEDGDSGLYAGEQWKFSDLLKFTLVVSSNDGASAIARTAGAMLANASSTDPLTDKELFIDAMNQKAKIIGLTDTHYKSESGLDIDRTTSGAYGSTRDMAMLFEYVYKKYPGLFIPTTNAEIDVRSLSGFVHHAENTNVDVGKVTGIIGSKTGYTDLAGGNLVVVVDIGLDHPVVIAVLGSTYDGRFADVKKLLDATIEKITGETLPQHS